MAEKTEAVNLGYLGVDYQYRLVKTFIENPSFFCEISGIVEPSYFSEATLRLLVSAVKECFNKDGIVPSYEILKYGLLSKARTELDRIEIETIIDKIKNGTQGDGLLTIQEIATKFFKQQNYVKIAKKIIECAENGDTDRFEEVQHLWDEASLIGSGEELPFSPFDIIDKVLSERAKVPIPTGVSKLDDVLGGGLEKKKLGVIIGSAGFGKSTFSTAIAAYASTFSSPFNNNEGFKVLQIYFEDEDIDIARKHFARVSTIEMGFDVEAKDLTKTLEDINQIKGVLENYPNKEMMKKNLMLKSFATNTKTASDIEKYIKRTINRGFKPDLVIVDYFECLLPEKGTGKDSEWSRQAFTMRKLENIAKSLDIAIWVPTQGNKGSFSSELVTMEQAGGSVTKVQIGHVIISIARSLEDLDNNLATIAVLKNRSGKSGMHWDKIRFNNGTCMISCDEVVDYESALSWKEEAEQIKKEAHFQRIRELRNKINEDGS